MIEKDGHLAIAKFPPKDVLFQNNRQRQYLCPHILVQRVKFRFKFIGHLDGPFDATNMTWNTLWSQVHIHVGPRNARQRGVA
ncbi:MAG TPA: hypothetical protein VGR94_03340 [Candidatus Acidoferrales bacterium]|nr:hypothetical protein [Candidatus Acidoferrales bacterium]